VKCHAKKTLLQFYRKSIEGTLSTSHTHRINFTNPLAQSPNDLGSISTTCLLAALTPVAPKSIRIQSSCQYLFTLLGSATIKAVYKMLVKLTPGAKEFGIISFTNKSASNFTSNHNKKLRRTFMLYALWHKFLKWDPWPP
jgi:hypothetical protein